MTTGNAWKRSAILFLACSAAANCLQAQTLTTLASFNGKDGSTSYSSIVQGTDGNFYGTTFYGGAQNVGAVFKVTPAGVLTTLYSFCSQNNCADGTEPRSGLVLGASGDLYGVTPGGGNNNNGIIYKISPKGNFSVVYTFCQVGNCLDGSGPLPPLTLGIDGNFYGVTAAGGATNCHCGTVFKLTPQGNLTTLYSFCSLQNCADGEIPDGALVQATNGDFYGVTQEGGAKNSGTVFSITSSGSLSVLYSFCSARSCFDGSSPSGALVQASNDRLYGTTDDFGRNQGGNIFGVAISGEFRVLYNFTQGDGPFFDASLIQGTDGNLYDTTTYGGSGNSGTIFSADLSGAYSTIYNFSGGPDGGNPCAGLFQGTDGNFYGTTTNNGPNGYGTVFRLSMGFSPFVRTIQPGGAVGRQVAILGNNLIGATSVTFNGTPATFTVRSSTLITAQVPVGATTGTVQVILPSETLSSNLPFYVRQ